jgi:glycosyltransferase involved in cell wall biosynthesis
MSAPVVSIVLPVYNAGTLLPQALDSIFRQSFQQWELILVDDGSTDGCMAGFSVADPRVRVVQDGRNEGLAARLNQGIDLARGRYLARMDQDDIAYPERLQAQVKFLQSHPDIDLVATRTLLFRNDGSVIGLSPLRQTHLEICAAPWRGFFLPHPTWMGRIEWFRRHRYRIPEYVRAEDQELLLRSHRASQFACLPEVLLGYRQSGLPLKKVLLARKHLAIAQWSVNMAQGHPGHAILGFLAYAFKALADAALAVAGAQHLFVRRQARGAPQKEVDRWREVWKESQTRSGASPPSPYAIETAPCIGPDR